MLLSRRQALVTAAGALVASTSVACSSAQPRSTPRSAASPADAPSAGAATAPVRHSYGPDPSQFGQLYRPNGTPHAGTIVLIHGGFWLAQYDLSLDAPMAQDLVRRGYVVWNLEYRRVGDGGGWPTTLDDVAAGIDHLATLGVDTTHVVAIGHSAGGQLAAWAAGRATLPATAPGARPRVVVTAVVSQAGVLDLATACNQRVGGSAESDFIGGTPAQQPERYAWADPIQQVPLPAPVLCVHSRADANVPFAQSSAYVAAATKAGARATLTEVPGDHFTLIDPTSPAWAVVVAALPALFA
jgi:acetyl esterase/lipase